MWNMDPKKFFFSNICAVVLKPFFNKSVFNLMVWDATLLISKVNLVMFLNFQLYSRSTHLFMPHCFSYRRFRVYLYLTRFCVCVCVCVCVCARSVLSNFLQPHELYPPRLFCPWDFPDKNTGMGCHFLLQGIFLIQGSNLRLLCLLHWREDSLLIIPPGKPLSKVISPHWLFPAPRFPYMHVYSLFHTNCHMTQQSHCWAYTPRKPELKETCVPQCSSQHCLQQPGHGSKLDVHWQMNG